MNRINSTIYLDLFVGPSGIGKTTFVDFLSKDNVELELATTVIDYDAIVDIAKSKHEIDNHDVVQHSDALTVLLLDTVVTTHNDSKYKIENNYISMFLSAYAFDDVIKAVNEYDTFVKTNDIKNTCIKFRIFPLLANWLTNTREEFRYEYVRSGFSSVYDKETLLFEVKGCLNLYSALGIMGYSVQLNMFSGFDLDTDINSNLSTFLKDCDVLEAPHSFGTSNTSYCPTDVRISTVTDVTKHVSLYWQAFTPISVKEISSDSEAFGVMMSHYSFC